ncbi:MAG: histidine kinase [Bacteroidota bacterium]
MRSLKYYLDVVLQNRLATHLLFWMGLVTIFISLASLNSGTIKANVANYLALLPAQIGAAYLLNYYQIPKQLLKKRYFSFFVGFILSIYFFTVIGRLSIIYIAEPFFRENFTQESLAEILSDSAYLFSVYFPSVYIYALIMLLIKAFQNRFKEKHKIEVLQKEKAFNELRFLRGQIQPHFLFNTLNNLYGLTLAKSDLAPEVVLKLSEILDFILHQGNEPQIEIKKELELLNAYIELESLRHGDKLSVTFHHEIDNENVTLAPLLILPLVENSFKHGISPIKDTSEIVLDLKVSGGNLNFMAKNQKGHNRSMGPIKPSNSGIGITNLKRQLELNYPKKHDLRVFEDKENFEVQLELELV